MVSQSACPVHLKLLPGMPGDIAIECYEPLAKRSSCLLDTAATSRAPPRRSSCAAIVVVGRPPHHHRPPLIARLVHAPHHAMPIGIDSQRAHPDQRAAVITLAASPDPRDGIRFPIGQADPVPDVAACLVAQLVNPPRGDQTPIPVAPRLAVPPRRADRLGARAPCSCR